MTTKTSPVAFGRRLKAKRDAEGLTLRELARIVGVSFSSLGRIERGDGGTTPDTIRRLSLWLERGEASAGKRPPSNRGQPWIISVEARLARLEKIAGIE